MLHQYARKEKNQTLQIIVQFSSHQSPERSFSKLLEKINNRPSKEQLLTLETATQLYQESFNSLEELDNMDRDTQSKPLN